MSETNATPTFTDDDLWALLMAVRDKYEATVKRRSNCSRHVGSANADTAQKFQGYVAYYDDRLAELDAIAAKFPEYMRKAWAKIRTEIQAEAAAA